MIISAQRPSMDQEAHDRQMQPRFTGETMGNTNSWEDEDRVFLILRVQGDLMECPLATWFLIFFAGLKRSRHSAEPGERSLSGSVTRRRLLDVFAMTQAASSRAPLINVQNTNPPSPTACGNVDI